VTLISQVSETYFELTTAKGREIGVSFHRGGTLGGAVSVYVQRPGLSELVAGKHFYGVDALDKAIAAYKAADIRSALEALR
jgi:hypothetical protein